MAHKPGVLTYFHFSNGQVLLQGSAVPSNGTGSFKTTMVMETMAALRSNSSRTNRRGKRFKQWLIVGGVILGFMVNDPAKGQSSCDLSVIEPAESGMQRAGSICNGNDPPSSSSDYQTTYSQMTHWIPDANTPIKVVPVAVHVFQPTGGSPAFLDIPAHRALIQQQIDWVNGWYANNCTPFGPDRRCALLDGYQDPIRVGQSHLLLRGQFALHIM